MQIGVHIADVSSFVPPGSVLDDEARARGQSVYFVDRVIPMLPRRLCEELCSLNPDVERLAFSMVWVLNERGEAEEQPWIGPSVIRSCAKLSYEDAQVAIDEGRLPDAAVVSGGYERSVVVDDIQTMNRLAQCRRMARFEKGAISIQLPRPAFKLDERGVPVEMWAYALRSSNQLVEEFMLLANISAAEKLQKCFPR